MMTLKSRNMLILQNKKNLTESEINLYNGYENILHNIFDRACDPNSSMDPFTSEYVGKNSIKYNSNYYSSLLEITSYFWASKGGRGTLLEKTLQILAGDSATQGTYLSSFLNKLIESHETLSGKVSSKLKKKFDLMNMLEDSLIILELKNRVDSGGTAARKEALKKFFELLDHIRNNTVIFEDMKTKEKYTLQKLFKLFGIKNFEMLMGFLYNVKGTNAKILDDQTNGFYSESKKLVTEYGSKNPDMVLDISNLKINFDTDQIKNIIQTIYGNDVSEKFTKSNKSLHELFQKVFLKSWDDVWLALNVGIAERNLLLKTKTNNLLHIQHLNNIDLDFKSELHKFITDSDNLRLISNILKKIRNSEGGGGSSESDQHLTDCLYVCSRFI